MCKVTNLIETQLAYFFNGLSLNYALLKKRGIVIVEVVWSTWKPILFFHNSRIKSSFLGER